jgi:hypothetical protein
MLTQFGLEPQPLDLLGEDDGFWVANPSHVS